jgi:hypothetical protein
MLFVGQFLLYFQKQKNPYIIELHGFTAYNEVQLKLAF